MLLRHCCRFRQQHCRVRQQCRTQLRACDKVNLIRLCRKGEISFDIVAKNGNNVETTFDFVERIVRLVAYDNIASTLLLVWTGLKSRRMFFELTVRHRQPCFCHNTHPMPQVGPRRTAVQRRRCRPIRAERCGVDETTQLQH